MSRDVCEHFVPLELLCEKCSSKLRWYEILDEVVYIYDTPYRNQSNAVSIVPPKDLKYYRRNFQLSKIWGEKPPC